MKQLQLTGIYILLLAATLFLSCQPEEQMFTFDPAAKLRFSADTVLFDTVFTDALTITNRFIVYNDDPKAINISSIILESSDNSPFTITVNGLKNRSFESIRLLGGDSMLVLVDAFIDPKDEDLPFIVEDAVLFETNGNLQQVQLIAWGQDAFYFSDSILACNTIWTGSRPYVIFNSILVDSLCTLTINPGTKIFSHKESSIFVKGTINAVGTSDQRITFLNDRLDDKFKDSPGQWGGIFFLEGSRDNRIAYTDIRNSEYGIWLGTPDNDTIPDLVLESVKIENISRTGLIAFSSDLTALNCLFDNCAEFVVGNFAGGNYRYLNCTFSNFSFTFFRENPLFVVSDNLVLADGTVVTEEVKLYMLNSIIWGDFNDEIILNNDGGADFQVSIRYSILKTTSLDFDINNNLLNTDPLFVNPFGYDYHIDSLSPAINAGIFSGVDTDLDGIKRDSLPDLGAYERHLDQ